MSKATKGHNLLLFLDFRDSGEHTIKLCVVFLLFLLFITRNDFNQDHLPTFNTRSQGHCFTTDQLLKYSRCSTPPPPLPPSSCQFCLKRFHIMSRNIGCQSLLAPNSRIMEAPGVPGVHCLTRQSLIARPPPVQTFKRGRLSASTGG